MFEAAHSIAVLKNQLKLHFVRLGTGPSVLLLHGWPGFWYDWRHLLHLLAASADVIAPDFRGFGESDKPDLDPATAYTPQAFAQDLFDLLDQLEIRQVILVAQDIGATVAQVMSRMHPERIRGLVLLNPPYPGIGDRRFLPAAQREFWYQHLHSLPLAEQLVGYNRDTVAAYLQHFYHHWCSESHRPAPEEMEVIFDTYAKPNAFKSSILYYRARAGSRGNEASTDPKALQIHQPTRVLWGELDPVIPSAWSDRLADYFSDYTLRLLPDIGHFVSFEAPEEVLKEIHCLFDRIDPLS